MAGSNIHGTNKTYPCGECEKLRDSLRVSLDKTKHTLQIIVSDWTLIPDEIKVLQDNAKKPQKLWDFTDLLLSLQASKENTTLQCLTCLDQALQQIKIKDKLLHAMQEKWGKAVLYYKTVVKDSTLHSVTLWNLSDSWHRITMIPTVDGPQSCMTHELRRHPCKTQEQDQ